MGIHVAHGGLCSDSVGIFVGTVNFDHVEYHISHLRLNHPLTGRIRSTLPTLMLRLHMRRRQLAQGLLLSRALLLGRECLVDLGDVFDCFAD